MARLDGAKSDQTGASGVYPALPSVVPLEKQSSVAVVQPASDAKAANQQTLSQGKPPSPGEIKAAAKQIESYLKSVGRQLEFRIDDDSGRTVITVKDSHTGEVIRQIPGDETMRLARSLGGTSSALVDLEA